MNAKQIVKLSNIIGISSIILLVYWVFTFIVIEVFGLKVFRENMTESFYLSILGILALMAGSLIVNLMFNLTRIAERKNEDEVNAKSNRRKFAVLLLIFPLILIILFGGNYLTSAKKEKMLISSAKSIIESNKANSDKLLNYTFSKSYIKETTGILRVLSVTDKNFPSVTLIVKDSIKDSPVFLGFNAYYNEGLDNDTIQPQKVNYIYQTTKEERAYLNEVFNENSEELRYSSSNGNYELFYPYKKNGKTIIIYFSEQQRYGKLGS
ncbi:peptidase [Flavobacterium sharifuzzamanii]|uniref:peptidase n=1 Tax=Flavobacterium sharifuzzamanii TaxID=2211133 RepID=UPI000DAF42A4|nr:peptidase [Flavobacterium sharifuzzamanii]KAF2079761.1 peptidase [Flavobacterium sharifuzzamanii]